ncbi:hypothetical protein AB0950_17895 [Streptomyces sp. NPDC007189]|uniref:hypothetical protein n=1 Tax=Streptomyces sp. NPDC007189 TaxID=3154315 RepID=UPI0034524558
MVLPPTAWWSAISSEASLEEAVGLHRGEDLRGCRLRETRGVLLVDVLGGLSAQLGR